MDDYTLFSRRRLVPYGQSYAPNTSGRFEQGNMRIHQMQRAQEQAIKSAMDVIAQNPNARAMLLEGLAKNEFPPLPNPDANADMPGAYDAPAATTLRSAPVPKMADDYTLFSPRRLVPYGQSYAPNRSAYAPNRTGRFFKGMMTNPIKFTPQGSQSTRQEQERMLMQARQERQRQERRAAEIAAEARPLAIQYNPRLPNPDANADMPGAYDAPAATTLRSAPVPKMGNTQPRVELPSWVTNRGMAVAPFNIGNKNSPTLPSFAYADRLESSAPQSPVDRAITTAKGIPQQVYRAVTNPVETAKAVANAVLSGEDYQSTSEPVVQNGVINWGDPDNSADFFRADQALQELHPYVEPETPPEPANEGYSNGGIVSELLNEVVDFVNPGFAGGGEVGGEYDYVEPETVYDDEYDYVEPETVYDDEYDYVEPEMAEDLDGFAHGGPALMQDEYPTEYLPEVGRQVMAGGGEVDNPIVDEAYGEPMSDRARMRQTAANIAPREGEAPVVDGEGWQRTLQNYRNFPVRPGEATMRPRDDWRAKAAAVIAGEGGPSYGSELRRRAGEALFGPTYGVGLTDVLALPTVIDAAQAYRKGNTGEAAINAATLGIPFAAAARKPIGAALRTARDVITSPVGRGAAGATSAAVMSPDDAEAANILKAVKGSFKGSDLIKKDPAAATEKPSRKLSLDEIRKEIGNDELFVRWSLGPKYDMRKNAVSKDWQTGQQHNGLSSVSIKNDMSDVDLYKSIGDYSYLQRQNGKVAEPHLYRGKSVGVDSDNSPVIRPSSYLGTPDGSVIAKSMDDGYIKMIEMQASLVDSEKALAWHIKNGSSDFQVKFSKDMVERQKKLLTGILEKMAPEQP